MADRGVRIAKRLAESGYFSRRSAETLIAGGKVSVNGILVSTPASFVSETDAVAVNGVPLQRNSTRRIFVFYKPSGLLVTHRDPKSRKRFLSPSADRPTVFDFLSKFHFPPYIHSVGRLDYNTEGLLLLTNDGEYSRLLELPSSGVPRRYRVVVRGNIYEKWLHALKYNGITIDDIRYKPIDIQVLQQKGKKSTLQIVTSEGKNREIRNILKHMNLDVDTLQRTDFGPYNLGRLKSGSFFESMFYPPEKLKKFAFSTEREPPRRWNPPGERS